MKSYQPFVHFTNKILPGTKVFGVSASPRKGGNSDILLRHILKGVDAGNVPADSIRLADISYDPCIGCEHNW